MAPKVITPNFTITIATGAAVVNLPFPLSYIEMPTLKMNKLDKEVYCPFCNNILELSAYSWEDSYSTDCKNSFDLNKNEKLTYSYYMKYLLTTFSHHKITELSYDFLDLNIENVNGFFTNYHLYKDEDQILLTFSPYQPKISVDIFSSSKGDEVMYIDLNLKSYEELKKAFVHFDLKYIKKIIALN